MVRAQSASVHGVEPARPGDDTRARPVLVVEDDEDLRTELAELLREEGYEVVEAANGERALAYLLDAQKPWPAVMLLDLMMPVMNGRELLAVLEEDLPLAILPIVLLSAGMVDAAKHAVSDVLPKPCMIHDLLA